MSNFSLPINDDGLTATHWRTLRLLNIYRLIITLIFASTLFTSQDKSWLDYNSLTLYNICSVSYLVFAFIAAACTWWQRPKLEISVTTQTILDIIFIILLMSSLGGSKSGVGLLLVINIAGASLVSQGRLALFYAAIATIGLLLEQTYRALNLDSQSDGYTQTAMLSLSCFTIAWLAHSLAKRMQQSETLASQRGIDLENLAQINALITHEMQDGVLVVDHKLMVKQHNTQAENLLGIGLTSRDELWLEQPLSTTMPALAKLIRLWEQDQPSSDVASNRIAKLQTEARELRLRFLPVSAQHSDGVVIFIEDWSQTQTQAQQLKLAALGRLTANIAHEIRNPLSAISHANQLLQEDAGSNSTSQRMLQIIADNVQRVDQIVKDVLELNRRDRTNQEIIQLELFLTEFHHQFCIVENIPAAAFKLILPATHTPIMFDHRHLNQILWNLCKNGWRHCKEQEGSLTLNLVISSKIQLVEIEISDDGSGVPADIMPHLFEPFFTTENSGTGLGLYIARELCEANGAKIQYHPAEKGSQFIISLKKLNSQEKLTP